MTPAGSIPLSVETFAKLFPFYWTVDDDLKLTDVGPSLGKICPDIAAGDALDRHFHLVRPNSELGPALRSLSEHMLATYVGKFFGEHSFFIHIISIAVVIAILMPIRQRVERGIEGFFAKKKVKF